MNTSQSQIKVGTILKHKKSGEKCIVTAITHEYSSVRVKQPDLQFVSTIDYKGASKKYKLETVHEDFVF